MKVSTQIKTVCSKSEKRRIKVFGTESKLVAKASRGRALVTLNFLCYER